MAPRPLLYRVLLLALHVAKADRSSDHQSKAATSHNNQDDQDSKRPAIDQIRDSQSIPLLESFLNHNNQDDQDSKRPAIDQIRDSQSVSLSTLRKLPQSAIERRNRMPASPRSNSSLDRRQLVRPSTHIPWSVDVVSAVPKKLVDQLDVAVASASCPGWACLAMKDGFVHVWQHKAIALSDTLEPPKDSLKQFFPDLVTNDGDDLPPQLAMTGDLDSVNLFGLHQGILVMRKISRKDIKSKLSIARNHATRHRVMVDEEGEKPTSLTADPDTGSIFIGTSKGNLYWVTHTAVPVGIHTEKVVPPTGFWNRLGPLLGYGGTESNHASQHHVLPISATEFVSVSSTSLAHWNVTQTLASSHHATFDMTSSGNWRLEGVRNPEIITAALSADHRSMHCIVRGGEDTKLYWIEVRINDGTVLRSHWLSRFALPDQVQVFGLTTSENGNAYAAFGGGGGVVTVMVLLKDENIVQEVDLPATQVPSLLPNMVAKDVVTHGCSMVATSGIGLRIRYMAPSSALPPSKRARLASSTSSNPSVIHTLVSHLRSSFWQSYEDPDVHRPMPPSLRQAAAVDLEQTIITFAIELQHKGDIAQNPMEWHKAFVQWLQEGGLYRSLSDLGRWKLLSIGQELAVFGQICRLPNKWTEGTLSSYDLADWFLEIQTRESQRAWPHASLWNQLLALSLDAACTYREENANPFYDVANEEDPPGPLWLSHHSLQTVMLQQLEAWNRKKSDIDKQHLESVVKAALQSYADSYPTKETYAKVKELAIGLLRRDNDKDDGDDELAFELSIQYQYFEGVCQISVDHEKKQDARNYSLNNLFASSQPGQDLLTGFSFAQFVLQWHTDKGLYGHAINYGQHSPNDLNLIMMKDERLRQYRWIPASRHYDWDQNTESCLAICDHDKTLATNEWALSMAKLANKLVATQNTRLQAKIERQLEIVNAQQMLMEEEGDDEDAKDRKRSSPLRTPEELVRLAMRKLPAASSIDDRVRLATIALAVCASMDDDEKASVLDYTAHVWAECLRLDAPAFTEWLRNESNLTHPDLRERVLRTTVFGSLWLECRKDDSMSPVTYGRHLETAVIEKIGNEQKLEFSRLLRSVTTSTDSIKGQSLVVASY